MRLAAPPRLTLACVCVCASRQPRAQRLRRLRKGADSGGVEGRARPAEALSSRPSTRRGVWRARRAAESGWSPERGGHMRDAIRFFFLRSTALMTNRKSAKGATPRHRRFNATSKLRGHGPRPTRVARPTSEKPAGRHTCQRRSWPGARQRTPWISRAGTTHTITTWNVHAAAPRSAHRFGAGPGWVWVRLSEQRSTRLSLPRRSADRPCQIG